MAHSIIQTIIEEVRRARTGDDRYFKSMPYYFKLITKPNEGPSGPFGTALFPLPVHPEELDYEMPFAANVEPLQEGGVSVDEAGIVVAHLRIAGTTGFKLRKPLDDSFPGNGKWTGLLSYEQSSGQELSGQMLLWRLLGRCFDSYGELKKNAEVASSTYLEWHNIKDQIHQLVIPKNVRVTRNKSRERVTYRYEITCDVIGTAERNQLEELLVDDESDLISMITDAVSTLRKTIRQIGAAIDEVTAMMDSVRRFVSNVADTLDDVKSVVGAALDFVDGVKGFIDTTKGFQQSLADKLDEINAILQTAEAAGSEDAKMARVLFANLTDHVETIIVASQVSMKRSFDDVADRHAQKVQRFENMTDQEKSAAADLKAKASSSRGTMNIKETVGGPIKAGDEDRISIGDDKPNLLKGQWNGFKEIEVTHGDTIFSIAIKHMGSGTYWRDIATVNHLKPPYISTGARIPSTLAPGDKIMIPISKSSVPSRVQFTGDRVEGSSQAASMFGRDLRLTRLVSGNYGWVVDIAHGSTDVLTVVGVPNMVQGLETRMRNELRHDLCFPGVGLPRLVGNKSIGETWMEARIAIQQQLLSDPRIQHVAGMKFSQEADVLTIDVDARPVGFDTNRTIPLTVS